MNVICMFNWSRSSRIDNGRSCEYVSMLNGWLHDARFDLDEKKSYVFHFVFSLIQFPLLGNVWYISPLPLSRHFLVRVFFSTPFNVDWAFTAAIVRNDRGQYFFVKLSVEPKRRDNSNNFQIKLIIFSETDVVFDNINTFRIYINSYTYLL